ncbi:hypothetical protein [Robbsia andropogonis]|uniref:hypothetical protein n=1 Tax=Robbsia andropogonis TaxID=28092 RepID=UPI0020A08185|nr:hypothetical protein [Robbsia andropogonis]MCP1126320.1 hypothetical protein [Robbsia andropogonis]
MKNAIALGVITDAKSVEPVACTNCNGSGIGGGQMHVDENGNSEYEPYKCERCDGFGRTPPSAGDVRDAALEEAAKHLDKKADEYVHEFGCVDPDTGSLEFGQGPHADEKHEYYSTLLELAEEIRALKSKKEA